MRGAQGDRGTLELCPEPWVDALREIGSVAHGVAAPASSSRERIAFRKASVEGPPDAHRLPHGLHLCPELLVGTRELLEGEAGET